MCQAESWNQWEFEMWGTKSIYQYQWSGQYLHLRSRNSITFCFPNSAADGLKNLFAISTLVLELKAN